MGEKEPLFFKEMDRIIEVTSGVFLVGLSAVVITQVVARYFFNYSFSWAEELPILLFTWVSFLGASAAFRKNMHLSITFVFDLFPKSIKKLVLFLNLMICMTFFSILAYYAFKVSFRVSYSTFVTLKISKLFMYIAIPIACILIIAFTIEKIYELKEEGSSENSQ